VETPREGRNSFRIDDNVHLRIQYLSEPEFQVLSGRFSMQESDGLVAQVRALTNQTKDLLTEIRETDPAVARYLQAIDRKIEHIARHIDDALTGLKPDARVNLGTGGLAYWHDAPLPIGARLELHMVLFPAHVHIGALARVVHSAQDPDAPPGQRFRVGVEFENINKTDQEALARHLIELQCAQIHF
jgi:hypothetical protein